MQKTALWVITPNGLKVARKVVAGLADVDLLAADNLDTQGHTIDLSFSRLSDAIAQSFHSYRAHIFIMSTGIVVRMLAAHIRHKTIDPAVVVIDELGRHAISLLCGHLGGANQLAYEVAAIIGAEPVITTATDLNQVPAIDVIAAQRNLRIENPMVIKTISMAMLRHSKIWLYDPFGAVADTIPVEYCLSLPRRHPGQGSGQRLSEDITKKFPVDSPGVYIDDRVVSLGPEVLILRPRSLCVGIGCNRNTASSEIKDLLAKVLDQEGLSRLSIACIASVDLKKDEAGLIKAAEDLDVSLKFYTRTELNRVETIATPSAVVEKHIGVKSVCEAAAILAAQKGELIVPKKASRNVTVAIARRFSIL